MRSTTPSAALAPKSTLHNKSDSLPATGHLSVENRSWRALNYIDSNYALLKMNLTQGVLLRETSEERARSKARETVALFDRSIDKTLY